MALELSEREITRILRNDTPQKTRYNKLKMRYKGADLNREIKRTQEKLRMLKYIKRFPNAGPTDYVKQL